MKLSVQHKQLAETIDLVQRLKELQRKQDRLEMVKATNPGTPQARIAEFRAEIIEHHLTTLNGELRRRVSAAIVVSNRRVA